MAEIYLYAGKNQTYASQGRIAANACADKVIALYKRDKQLQEYYNNQMSNGKWCGMMQDGHFGYTKWAMPKYDSIPAVQYVTPLPKAALGVVAEGGGELPTFDNMDHPSYYIDVFNRGKGDLSCKVKANEKWILLNKRVNSSIKFSLNQDEIRLNFSIDWDKLPIGDSEGTVTISAGGENKLVKIQVVIVYVGRN